MIHEVKVFDGSGNLKKVVSGKKMIKQFWKRFDQDRNYFRTNRKAYIDQHGTGPIFQEGDEELYGPGAFE